LNNPFLDEDMMGFSLLIMSLGSLDLDKSGG